MGAGGKGHICPQLSNVMCWGSADKLCFCPPPHVLCTNLEKVVLIAWKPKISDKSRCKKEYLKPKDILFARQFWKLARPLSRPLLKLVPTFLSTSNICTPISQLSSPLKKLAPQFPIRSYASDMDNIHSRCNNLNVLSL